MHVINRELYTINYIFIGIREGCVKKKEKECEGENGIKHATIDPTLAPARKTLEYDYVFRSSSVIRVPLYPFQHTLFLCPLLADDILHGLGISIAIFKENFRRLICI